MTIDRLAPSNRLAFAQDAHLHGATALHHCVRESRRAWFWGPALPLAIALAALAFGPWALAAAAIYPLQVLRLTLRGDGRLRDRFLQAVFHRVDRFPEMMGQLQFARDRWLGRRSGLIEYK